MFTQAPIHLLYYHNYIAYSIVHDPQGTVTGPTGFASREADATGAGGPRLKGLRKVLLVVGRDFKKKKIIAKATFLNKTSFLIYF